MTELLLTAYDINGYLAEALPALKAAIYRGNLAPAKELLVQHDAAVYGEYDLMQLLGVDDLSWLFTEQVSQPERFDPDGALIGLTYPLILAYHRPETFRMIIGGSEFKDALPFLDDYQMGLPGIPGTEGLVQPGYNEGLRAMWEIVGYIGPRATAALREYCLSTVPDASPIVGRLLTKLANGLIAVIQQGYGLVVERD